MALPEFVNVDNFVNTYRPGSGKRWRYLYDDHGYHVFERNEGGKRQVFWIADSTPRQHLFMEFGVPLSSLLIAKECEKTMLEFLKKGARQLSGRKAQVEVDDPEFAKKFPVLCALMTYNLIDEKTTRDRCKLSVFCEGGRWKACLTDMENKASLFVTLGTPTEAFKALEKALEPDEPDWRPWRDQKNKKG